MALNDLLSSSVASQDATPVQAGFFQRILKELLGINVGNFPVSLTSTANKPVTLTGVIVKDFTSLSSPAGGTPQLKNFVLPGGSLQTASPGQALRIRGWGTLANNVNAKSVLLKFGATTVITVPMTASTANFWHIDAIVAVRGATSQIASAIGAQGTGTPTHVENQASPAETISGDITVQFTGVQTAAADIVQDGLLAEWIA